MPPSIYELRKPKRQENTILLTFFREQETYYWTGNHTFFAHFELNKIYWKFLTAQLYSENFGEVFICSCVTISFEGYLFEFLR